MTGTHKGPRTAAQMDTIFNTVYNSNLSATHKITRSNGAIVAASNSTIKEISQADYVCNGTDDQIKIQEALDDFKNVRLLNGTFTVTDDITTPEYGVLSGNGMGNTTIIQSKSTTLVTGDPVIFLNAHSTCENLTLHANGWTDKDLDTNGIKLLDYSTLQNCEILEARQYAVFTSGAIGAKIINNVIHHTLYPLCFRGVSGEYGWSDRCIMYGNITHSTHYYNKIRAARNCIFANNICYLNDITDSGYNLDHGAGIEFAGTDAPYENIQIVNNMFIDLDKTSVTSGIDIVADIELTSNNVTISNNVIDGFYYGIVDGCKELLVQDNVIRNCRHSGIFLKYQDASVIQNNKLYNSGIILQDSINTFVDGNTVNGAMPYTTASGSGIFITCVNASYPTATGNNIKNNNIYNCAQGAAIYICKQIGKGTPINTIIEFNNVLNNNLYGVLDTSDGPTTIQYNQGYKTENTGSATLLLNTTSITVTHGLAATPTNVTVTPKGNIGSCWVDTYTATTFIIHCSTAPASNTDVNWTAIV